MKSYNQIFARMYNKKWVGFASQAAPLILDHYETLPISKVNRSVLDLCCGTGQLALHFLDKGYRVVGIDASQHMLTHARENAALYISSGKADFIHGDASDFKLDECFGLVVSTFDALNHLENKDALRKCFECVLEVCEGTFIFDLNTRGGLNRWNSIHVDESSPDFVIITRGIYDGQSDKAWTRISGFERQADGSYQRFEQTAFNTVFDMQWVKDTLLEIGWKHVHFARMQDLKMPISDPEQEGRVFIVANRKG